MAGLFIKLDTNFWSHPKVLAAGEPAAVLYQQMAMYCMDHTTDGLVPDAQLPRFGVTRLRQRLAALADVGMIERQESGWLVPGYVERYKTAAEVDELSRTRSEAGKKGGRPRKQVAKANGNQIAFTAQNPEEEVEVDEENPPPPEVTPVPTSADPPVVAVADQLIAALGYVDPPPANQGERNYVARALTRGWAPDQLHDLAIEAGARDDVRDHRAYLLGVLKRCANEDPTARSGPPPVPERLPGAHRSCTNPDCSGGMVGGLGPDGRPEPVTPCPDCHVLGAPA